MKLIFKILFYAIVFQTAYTRAAETIGAAYTFISKAGSQINGDRGIKENRGYKDNKDNEIIDYKYESIKELKNCWDDPLSEEEILEKRAEFERNSKSPVLAITKIVKMITLNNAKKNNVYLYPSRGEISLTSYNSYLKELCMPTDNTRESNEATPIRRCLNLNQVTIDNLIQGKHQSILTPSMIKNCIIHEWATDYDAWLKELKIINTTLKNIHLEDSCFCKTSFENVTIENMNGTLTTIESNFENITFKNARVSGDFFDTAFKNIAGKAVFVGDFNNCTFENISPDIKFINIHIIKRMVDNLSPWTFGSEVKGGIRFSDIGDVVRPTIKQMIEDTSPWTFGNDV